MTDIVAFKCRLAKGSIELKCVSTIVNIAIVLTAQRSAITVLFAFYFTSFNLVEINLQQMTFSNF